MGKKDSPSFVNEEFMSKLKASIEKKDLPIINEEVMSKIKASMDEKSKIMKDELFKTLESVVNKLDTTGWTLPPEMAIYPIKILGNTNEIKDIDGFFHKYFIGNDKLNFKSLTTKILNSNIEDKYKKGIEECIFAHENGRFIVASITLLTIIEGILSKFDSDKTNIRMMKVCQQQVDNIVNVDEKELLKKHMWVSYKNFITKLYAKSDFNLDEPSFINRHWLLHGRSEYNLSEVDCLKLFNAVSTIASIVDSDIANSK